MKPLPGLGSGGTGSAKPTVAGDVSIELDKVTLSGTLYGPAAMSGPGMPLVDAKRALTIAQQKSAVSNARDPVTKQAQSAILATMLYREAKEAGKKGDRPKEKELWTEARKVMRDAAAAAGKDVDELTFRLLGSYELLLEDYPAAEKAWADLIAKNPKDKEVPSHRVWQAFSLIKQGKNAEALALIKDEPLTDTQPERAYLTAWAKWRTGDQPGAWQAMVVAAKGWTEPQTKGDLEFEAMLLATRAKLPFAQVLPDLYTVYNAKQPAAQYEVLKTTYKAYAGAGRWIEGVAAIEEAIKVMGAQLSPADRPFLRYSQADYTVRLDTPDVVARYAKQAIEALAQCPKCSDKDKQSLVFGLVDMARRFQWFYATANDVRYYQPAHDIFEWTIPLVDPARRQEVSTDAKKLQDTLKNMRVGTGTHSKEAIKLLVEPHHQEVLACYETGLVVNPKLGGTLVLTLDSDQTGAIKGVATEPAGGQADLAAVASCVAERAKTWNLPKRGMAGTTRIKATFSLALKAAK